uniref:Macro domain-containing protein n=1 Tax=Ascaris lumbricoides TaxID=6252 RepID=A0A0M3HTU3_ASCLU
MTSKDRFVYPLGQYGRWTGGGFGAAIASSRCRSIVEEAVGHLSSSEGCTIKVITMKMYSMLGCESVVCALQAPLRNDFAPSYFALFAVNAVAQDLCEQGDKAYFLNVWLVADQFVPTGVKCAVVVTNNG